MKRAILVALLAVFASPSAFASPANTIEVVATVNHRNVARLPPGGRGGDAESTYWVIRDRHGRTVGDLLLACRWVTGDLRLCAGQLSMPYGSLALIGASRTPLVGQLTVVGGVGEYAAANGVLTFKAIGLRRYVLTAVYKQH
jgi:hypothetical protein